MRIRRIFAFLEAIFIMQGRFYRPVLLTRLLAALVVVAVLLSACLAGGESASGIYPLPEGQGQPPQGEPEQPAEALQASPTPPFPTRPRYAPGELVDYTAQTGDTLAGLALRFNTSVGEILEANSFIPVSATTMPPGMPMKIPIYYLPLWGSPYRILPDSHFVNGPAQVGFDTQAFVDAHPGWLKTVSDYVSDSERTGAGLVDLVAYNYSISPRLLLALLEYRSGALSQPAPPEGLEDYPMGYKHWSRKGLFLQLAWSANQLNNHYYSYRTGALTELAHSDGRTTRLDPWQNAATASLHAYFNSLEDYDGFLFATSAEGLAKTYTDLFGDPWLDEQPHLAGSLEQPAFNLPFQPGDVWALTGGPHTGWGTGEPLAALDFAPPSKTTGCVPSAVWATAVADGIVVRSREGEVMLDLDSDGDERTGWNVFYLHVATEGRVPLGTLLKQGDPIGHPSCEGGAATGTHVHIARKYNGEWLPAAGFSGGILAFNLEGWVAHNGSQVYLGTLTRFTQTVTACTCSNRASFIQTDRKSGEFE
jgi:murein DD-endopeptidase MepM/ murein hydrolase activator NlpD